MNSNHDASPLNKTDGTDQDVDDLFAELEAEENTELTAHRMTELTEVHSQETSRQKISEAQKSYVTLQNDDEVLRFTTEFERCTVHFFHPDFARCSTMNAHCEQIAAKHAEHGTGDMAFGRVDVQHCPFVVEKLAVRILPCLIGFVKGVAKGRVTGFEGLCWDGKEDSILVTRALEERLIEWTVLKKALVQVSADDESRIGEDGDHEKDKRRRGIKGRKEQAVDEDDDWD